MNVKHAIIKFLRLGLDLLKADPQDQATIKALQEQNADLVARLANAEETAFNEAERAEVNEILKEFEAATIATTETTGDTATTESEPTTTESEPTTTEG